MLGRAREQLQLVFFRNTPCRLLYWYVDYEMNSLLLHIR